MKVVKYVLDALIYAACFVGVGILILMLLDFKLVSIQTGSMQPEIMVGDLCIVHAKSPTEEYRMGDVVTFTVEDIYVTHRIASDNGDGTFITMGDANNVPDSAVLKAENILGEVKFVVPRLGLALDFVTTSDGKLVLVAGIAILVTASLVLDNFVKPKKKRKDGANGSEEGSDEESSGRLGNE